MYRKCCGPDQSEETKEEKIMAAGGKALIFRQMYEHLSSTYTYLLACAKSGEALLIDPVIETVDRDIAAVDKIGAKLKYAINTHCHADHVTGTGEIRARLPDVQTGIAKAAGANADILYNHGDTVKIGDIELEVRATPGHTDGCVSYVYHNGGLVFTGDAVLINGCGRTDFQQGSSARLYESVHQQIFSLPDHYLIYPAHDYKGLTCSSVGEEKKHNPRLTKSKEEFIKIMENLNLSYPKQIDKSLPANLVCGVFDLMDEKTLAKVREDLEKAK